MRISLILVLCAAFGQSLATPPPTAVETRQLSPAQEIEALIAALSEDGDLSSFYKDVNDILTQIRPTATPTTINQAFAALESILAVNPGSLYATAAMFIEAGFSPSDLKHLAKTYSTGENSMTNENQREPASAIYPKKSPTDAPYSLTEEQLREVIYIPSDYTYGQKPPVIFVPATATLGGFAFGSNIRKQLTGVDYADPVWLNLPGFELGDIQVNAEFVAYAINYINGISNGQNVSVITWSQGSIDTQWALKYWPSTRNLVSDFISVSGDFHGTYITYELCPDFPTLPCDPAIVQQTYESAFIKVLRSGGGDSAYVPTTTIYSGFDEAVEPQQGKSASGYILDKRGVGVSNIYVQKACEGRPAAAAYYNHESMLLNPLTAALVDDALTHPGPGEKSRLDLDKICNQNIAPGHTLADVIATEATVPIAVILVAAYFPKIFGEPPIKPYARLLPKHLEHMLEVLASGVSPGFLEQAQARGYDIGSKRNTRETVEESIKKARPAFAALKNVNLTPFMFEPDDPANYQAFLKVLTSKSFDAISLGGGVRTIPELSELFTNIINACKNQHPNAILVFPLLPHEVIPALKAQIPDLS